jgi:hypothetical protein
MTVLLVLPWALARILISVVLGEGAGGDLHANTVPLRELPAGIPEIDIIGVDLPTALDITAGLDLNGDSVNNDLQVGVPYLNDGVGAKFFQSDLRVAKFFKLPERWGSIGGDFELYNIFNNINPSGYIGNQQASYYGKATAFAGDPLRGEQRLIQLGARYTF